ncbi:hypothetical protein I79_020602 [Cricetulus griseus]|uniref:Uncharacterized protein n=1 Tax=Cricetulus griseus TaxID=10029 RepID=G3IAI0_CRIGR|nr:hypothetical protein I79_020602 [Cricetulus griseus]
MAAPKQGVSRVVMCSVAPAVVCLCLKMAPSAHAPSFLASCIHPTTTSVCVNHVGGPYSHGTSNT